MPVPLKDFEAAVRRLAELREQGLARLSISPGGDVAVGIDPAAADAPKPGGGLFIDIFDTLTHIASDIPVEEFIRVRSVPRPGFAEAEQEEVSRAKYEVAAAAFPRGELIQRTWLRMTSKLPVLTAVEWEVLVRAFDSNLPEASAGVIPFGQLRLTTQRTPHTPFPEVEELLLGLDLGDVDDLLRALERLKEALVRTTAKVPTLKSALAAEDD